MQVRSPDKIFEPNQVVVHWNEIEIKFKEILEIRKEKYFFYVEFSEIWNKKQNKRSEQADLADKSPEAGSVSAHS